MSISVLIERAREMTRNTKDKKKQNRLFEGLLVLAVVSTAFFYFILSHGRQPYINIETENPVFEEMELKTDPSQKLLNLIDRVIYETLYENGISQNDVNFLQVQPHKQNGWEWEFTDLSIRCRDRQQLNVLKAILSETLTLSHPEVMAQGEPTEKGGADINVLYQDKLTHRIRLVLFHQRAQRENKRPKVSVIIDDLGYDRNMAESLMTLGLPLSYSILPNAPATERIVISACHKNCEIMLHLPMQPKNYPRLNPGPGTLLLSMDANEILEILSKDLERVAGARGVNNHMGSSFTENREKMLIILEELKRRNLFYIDSRTTANSIALELARQIGLAAQRRNVFLDNDPTLPSIRVQFERLLGISRQRGVAVGIAHPYEETVAILKEFSSVLRSEYQLVPASEIAN